MGQDTRLPDPGTDWLAEPHSRSQKSVQENRFAKKKKKTTPKNQPTKNQDK